MRSRRNVTSESPRRLWKARTLQGQRREGVTLRAVSGPAKDEERRRRRAYHAMRCTLVDFLE